MGMLRIAINGFGRIGKSFLRTLIQPGRLDNKIKIIAINIGKADIKTMAYMVKYDTIMGTYQGSVECRENTLIIDGHEITLFSELDAQKLPWAALKVDWVIEASGHYACREKAVEHITSGAKKVLITAPSSDADISIIMGVNEQEYKNQVIVSLGSCTSNALLPLLKIIDDYVTIEQAYFTAVHAYTNSQHLLDVDAQAKNIRSSRAAGLNMIPSSTGASEMIGVVLPGLKNKVSGVSIRVPVADVSLLDLIYYSHKKSSQAELLSVFNTASEGKFKNILTLSDEELVSCDYRGNPSSLIIDTALVHVNNNSGKILAWYDNEWGYSQRIKDFLLYTLNV